MASQITRKQVGPFHIHDSGAPSESTDYKTLVIVHGLAWQSSLFTTLLAPAAKNNARVVLISRRDYPGSKPLDDEERRILEASLPATAQGAKNMQLYMKDRAIELHDFLLKFAVDEDIPVEGGIILAGWSFGAEWTIAFLAHTSSFSPQLAKYMRRVVVYDPTYHALGYPVPPGFHTPLDDPALTPADVAKIYPIWGSSYYKHGETISSLESKAALSEPAPTFLTMTNEEAQSLLYYPPAIPGGSDAILLEASTRHGLFALLKEAALYMSHDDAASTKSEQTAKESGRTWSELEARFLWCDHSAWPVALAIRILEDEMECAKRAGEKMRDISIVRMRGANHFVSALSPRNRRSWFDLEHGAKQIHWEYPEQVLRALVADSKDETSFH